MAPGEPEHPHVDEPPSHPDAADAADEAADTPHGRAARRANRRAAATSATMSAATDDPRRRRLPRRFWAVVFFTLGFVALWVSILEAMNTSDRTPGSAFASVLQAAAPIASVLIPGFLLWNHPDAWSRARTLTFGTLVFAMVTFLHAVEGGLQATFKDLTPGTHPDFGWFIPSSLIYTSLVSLIGLLGLLYIGLGLSRTRDYAFTKWAIYAGYAILVVAALSVAGRLWTLTGVDFADPSLTWDLWVYITSVIAIGVLTILVWAYLTRVLTRGALSGEEPVTAWYVAAAGACLILAGYLVIAWSTFVSIENGTPLNDVIQYLREILTGLGYILLLVGFARGLPSLERVIWDDDEDAA